MDKYYKQAIANVIRYGDTDIFPRPIENHIFRDKEKETITLLKNLHSHFDEWLAKFPPAHEGALVPVNYTGFRWGTQLDPIWNLYFLSIVLSIAEKIELNRIPIANNCVFSYRCLWDGEYETIFAKEQNWRSFMERSNELAESHPYVVICDISEFYARIGHHRLENALAHLELKSDIPHRIMVFLNNFSGTNSFGLPVGGPAARILSELVLNQIDQLLRLDGVVFCRFADDYHIFASSMEDGFAKLLLITEKLQRTQGLQLQKSKTRIIPSAEFISTSPIRLDDHDAPTDSALGPTITERARGLLSFSMRFDPYSPTATEDYDQLRGELEKFDIIGLLQSELSKSRIHTALSRKIVSAVRYLDQPQRDVAIVSLLENAETLFPIFSSVLSVIHQVFSELTEDTQSAVVNLILSLISSNSHVLRVELTLTYAIRVLSLKPSSSVQETLAKIYANPLYTSLVRREVIIAMHRLKVWPWLSERRLSFRSMSPSERRAFIVASYTLKDEGHHWRGHVSEELSPFERLVREWASARAAQPAAGVAP